MKKSNLEMKKSKVEKIVSKESIMKEINEVCKTVLASEIKIDDYIVFMCGSHIKFKPNGFTLISQNKDEVATLPYVDYEIYLEKTSYGINLKFFEKGNCQMIEELRVFNF